MPPVNAPFKNQIKPYHKEDHLLFQFILTELISAHEAISELTFNLDNDAHVTPLTRLAGSGDFYARLFLWNNDGIMAQLKNYCALFVMYFKGNAKALTDKMYREAHRGWLLALEVLDRSQQKSVNFLIIERLAKKLITVLKRIAVFIAKIVEHFKENENILYFLIRNNEQMTLIMGKSYVLPIFQKIFVRGVSEAEDRMIQKYARRGFTHLIPAISSKCQTL